MTDQKRVGADYFATHASVALDDVHDDPKGLADLLAEAEGFADQVREVIKKAS